MSEESRDIIGSVGCANRGALIRVVPPAKVPAESAAKKRQSERKPPAEGTQGASSEHQPREAGVQVAY